LGDHRVSSKKMQKSSFLHPGGPLAPWLWVPGKGNRKGGRTGPRVVSTKGLERGETWSPPRLHVLKVGQNRRGRGRGGLGYDSCASDGWRPMGGIEAQSRNSLRGGIRPVGRLFKLKKKQGGVDICVKPPHFPAPVRFGTPPHERAIFKKGGGASSRERG